MKRLFVCSLLLSVSITVLIFANSFLPAKQSDEMSNVFKELLRPVFSLFINVEALDYGLFIRKIAHFVEFAALGFSMGLLLIAVKSLHQKTFYGFALFATLSIALVDECIQLCSDRNGSVTDIVLDFSGVLFGILLVILFRTLHGLLKDKRELNKRRALVDKINIIEVEKWV